MAQLEIPNRSLFRQPEVCEIASIQPYVLRSWEAEFPDLGVAKAKAAPRVYRRADVERVLRIKQLLFGEGLTLAGVRRKLSKNVRPTPRPIRRSSNIAELLRQGRARAHRAREERTSRVVSHTRASGGIGNGATATSSCGLTTAPKPRARRRQAGAEQEEPTRTSSVRLRRPAQTRMKRDVAQPGSAPDWGSGGRWFESSHPDQCLRADSGIPWVGPLACGHMVGTGGS